MLRECKKHGLTEYKLDTYSKGHRCLKCRSENVANSRRKRKRKLVEEFGGKCQICGYNKCDAALQFHHRDPNQKSFGISAGGVTRTWEVLLEEAKKCDLLCSNCHAEVENGMT